MKLTTEQIIKIVENAPEWMNHIGDYKGKLVPMPNSCGTIHNIDDLKEIAELRQQVKNLTSDTSNTAKMLGRRVDIETHLLQIYQGTMPIPSRQDCKVLALRLGTPEEYWGDYVKQYEFIADETSKAVH